MRSRPPSWPLSPALAEDAFLLAELGDLVDDEEIAGEVQPLDDVELLVELRTHPVEVWRTALDVAFLEPLLDLVPQPARVGVALPEVAGGQVGGDDAQIEDARARQLDGGLADSREPRQPGGHLGARAEVRGAGGRQPSGHVVEAAASADGREHLSQRRVGRSRVVNVVGRHHADPDPAGQCEQCVVAGVVEGLVVVGELDHDVVAAEHLDQPAQFCLCRSRTACRERSGHGALATTGERHPVPTMCRRQLGQVVDGATLFAAHLGGGDGARQPAVPPGSRARTSRWLPSGSGTPVWRSDSPRLSSAPKMVPTPDPRAASARRTTPYMPSWSVSASASTPRRAASATSASGSEAPSRKL